MSLVDVNRLLQEIVPDQTISKNSKKVGIYAVEFYQPLLLRKAPMPDIVL